jgi:NDP-sugar pyrophosphorylase family protein
MDTSYYKGLLQGVVKHSKVEIIDQHKLGAVWSVLSVAKRINDDEEVVIAHCDTSCTLNYNKFKKFVKDIDGCIVSNMGFHPHTLSKTVFAHSKTDGDKVLEIKEKAFYTDRFKDHASCGVYYFKKGAYVKKYFQQLMDEKKSHNGEYYVTLVFNLLIQDGLDVRSYLVDKVVSLGTPNDLRHFEAWMTIEKGGQIDNEMDLLLCHRYWEGYVNHKS